MAIWFVVNGVVVFVIVCSFVIAEKDIFEKFKPNANNPPELNDFLNDVLSYKNDLKWVQKTISDPDTELPDDYEETSTSIVANKKDVNEDDEEEEEEEHSERKRNLADKDFSELAELPNSKSPVNDAFPYFAYEDYSNEEGFARDPRDTWHNIDENSDLSVRQRRGLDLSNNFKDTKQNMVNARIMPRSQKGIIIVPGSKYHINEDFTRINRKPPRSIKHFRKKKRRNQLRNQKRQPNLNKFKLDIIDDDDDIEEIKINKTLNSITLLIKDKDADIMNGVSTREDVIMKVPPEVLRKAISMIVTSNVRNKKKRKFVYGPVLRRSKSLKKTQHSDIIHVPDYEAKAPELVNDFAKKVKQNDKGTTDDFKNFAVEAATKSDNGDNVQENHLEDQSEPTSAAEQQMLSTRYRLDGSTPPTEILNILMTTESIGTELLMHDPINMIHGNMDKIKQNLSKKRNTELLNSGSMLGLEQLDIDDERDVLLQKPFVTPLKIEKRIRTTQHPFVARKSAIHKKKRRKKKNKSKKKKSAKVVKETKRKQPKIRTTLTYYVTERLKFDDDYVAFKSRSLLSTMDKTKKVFSDMFKRVNEDDYKEDDLYNDVIIKRSEGEDEEDESDPYIGKKLKYDKKKIKKKFQQQPKEVISEDEYNARDLGTIQTIAENPEKMIIKNLRNNFIAKLEQENLNLPTEISLYSMTTMNEDGTSAVSPTFISRMQEFNTTPVYNELLGSTNDVNILNHSNEEEVKDKINEKLDSLNINSSDPLSTFGHHPIPKPPTAFHPKHDENEFHINSPIVAHEESNNNEFLERGFTVMPEKFKASTKQHRKINFIRHIPVVEDRLLPRHFKKMPKILWRFRRGAVPNKHEKRHDECRTNHKLTEVMAKMKSKSHKSCKNISAVDDNTYQCMFDASERGSNPELSIKSMGSPESMAKECTSEYCGQLRDAVNGRLASSIVTSVISDLNNNNRLKIRFGSSIHQSNRKPQIDNLNQFKTNETSDDIRKTEEMLKEIMMVLNKIIFDQVRRKICQRLAPDLQKYLAIITKPSKNERLRDIEKIEDRAPLPSVKPSGNFDMHFSEDATEPQPDVEQGDFLFPGNKEFMKDVENRIKIIRSLLEKYNSMSHKCRADVLPLKKYLQRNLYNLVEFEKNIKRQESMNHNSISYAANEKKNSKKETGPKETNYEPHKNPEFVQDFFVNPDLINQQLKTLGLADSSYEESKKAMVPREDSEVTDTTAGSELFSKTPGNKAEGKTKTSAKYKRLVEAAKALRKRRQHEEQLGKLFGEEKRAKKSIQTTKKEAQNLESAKFEAPLVLSLDTM